MRGISAAVEFGAQLPADDRVHFRGMSRYQIMNERGKAVQLQGGVRGGSASFVGRLRR